MRNIINLVGNPIFILYENSLHVAVRNFCAGLVCTEYDKSRCGDNGESLDEQGLQQLCQLYVS